MKLLILLFAFTPLLLNAEVVSRNEHGFQIQLEKVVSTNKKIAYQQFINVDQWWLKDHTWFGKSENLSIDARAGGCFCEIEGTKQVLHMTVSFINPNAEIRMIGGLGPLQMMGVQGGMNWKFEQLDSGKTKITHQYQVVGYLDGGLSELATIVDKVQSAQLDALAERIESTAK